MTIEVARLHQVAMPLRSPFRTSYGVEHQRDLVLVEVETDAATGWGECVALGTPHYNAEYADGAYEVLRRFLIPLLLTAPDVMAADVGRLLAPVKGQAMAKAAIEMAVLDAHLRTNGRSLADALGVTATHVDSGVAIGITGDVVALVDAVADAVAAGYRRVKLKIEPGWDVAAVRAVREQFPHLALQVDGNGAYTMSDVGTFAALDAFDLLLVEQPFADDDLLAHAALARQITTPVCLDETITSLASATAAIEIGACAVVNLKPGRVGGLAEAVRIHDLCRARSVGLWCGGMFETGLGRAVNVVLAGLPGFTLPGDLSGSDRYYTADLTDPFVIDDGRLLVPTGPGIGRVPRPEVLSERSIRSAEWGRTHGT